MSTTAETLVDGDLDSPREVLAFARNERRAADRAEANVLLAAVTWAEQHPPESIDEAATWLVPGVGDTGIPLAGPGAPLVSEFCLAELALALGISSDAGRNLVADAVELKYRLPKTWARVMAGDLQAWRARRVAQATEQLSMEAATWVDSQVAPFAHKIGLAALERLVEEAIARFMPDQARENADRAADGRHFDVRHHQVSFNGTSRIEGELDLADALDLDAAISQGADALARLGSTDSLDVRRSKAAGQLARNQLGFDLAVAGACGHTDVADPGVASTGSTTGPKPRRVVLFVHLSADAITGHGTDDLHLARVENQRQVVTAERVREWCGHPDAEVVVKPVIDTSEHLHVEGYEIPDRLREQVIQRDHQCVFPWCTRAARRCDIDHVIPWPEGETASDNVAPMCRRHHRLKTHGGWTYTMFEIGRYLWTSPHGYRYLRDHTGTLDVTNDLPTDPPEQ
jgi:hypothetical protein